MFLIWKVHSKYNNHYTINLPVEDRAVRKKGKQQKQTKNKL
jgi:hypothetical protein